MTFYALRARTYVQKLMKRIENHCCFLLPPSSASHDFLPCLFKLNTHTWGFFDRCLWQNFVLFNIFVATITEQIFFAKSSITSLQYNHKSANKRNILISFPLKELSHIFHALFLIKFSQLSTAFRQQNLSYLVMPMNRLIKYDCGYVFRKTAKEDGN